MIQIQEVYFFACAACGKFVRQVATFTPGVGVDVAELIRVEARRQRDTRPRCPNCGASRRDWRFEHYPPDRPPPPSGSPELDAARRGEPLPGSIKVVTE